MEHWPALDADVDHHRGALRFGLFLQGHTKAPGGRRVEPVEHQPPLLFVHSAQIVCNGCRQILRRTCAV